jgi:mannose/fructose/N-acetylgalactosamine-specific phosphotransferase system component IID|tara:strand:- start:788 stop:1117 length:330 start_codon:yes stop_codon:yes gene_type:complete
VKVALAFSGKTDGNFNQKLHPSWLLNKSRQGSSSWVRIVEGTSLGLLGPITGLVGAIIGLYVCYLLITLPIDMARVRNRDPLGWFLFGLVASPIAAAFVLWLVGDAEKH